MKEKWHVFREWISQYKVLRFTLQTSVILGFTIAFILTENYLLMLSGMLPIAAVLDLD